MNKKYSAMEMEHVRQMKKHGVPEKYVNQEEKEAKEETGMKKGGKVKPNFAKMFGNKMKPPGMNMGGMAGYKKGGMAGCYSDGGKVRTAEEGDGIAKRGKTGAEMVKMARGGSVSARADGIASKGKTKGRMC